MSGPAKGEHRGVRRTQSAIRSAFSRLVLSREFDGIRIDDIIREADVARSTFYQHFRSKEDVLCASMGPVIFEPLARAGLRDEPGVAVGQLVVLGLGVAQHPAVVTWLPSIALVLVTVFALSRVR